jgi:drug/metabolite transporter (DMT)-like permease
MPPPSPGTDTERPSQDLAAALGAVLIWGLVPVGTRYFVQRVDPFVFNVIRFAASCLAALPMLARARPWRWPRRDQALLALCGVLAVPGYNMPVSVGALSLSAGELGFLIATEPVMILTFTLLLRRRAMHARLLTGSFVALCGVAMTTGLLTAPTSFPWRGTLLALSGAASWSLYTALAGGLNERYGSFGATGSMLVIGAASLFALSWPLIPSGSWPALPTVLALAAMGLASSTVGFLLWNHASARMPAERLGLFLYLIPIVCLAGGSALLGEALTVTILAGGALTIGGVWLASRSRVRAAAAD